MVTVVAGEQQGETLHLRLWLMSCRVLKRGMEEAMMDCLVRDALARGVRQIIGYYYPTAKNGMVRDFYSGMGFAQASADAVGRTPWTLDAAAYQPKQPPMTIER